MSVDVNPDGAIKSVHTHTPHTQLNEISWDERRWTILTIKGILKKGRIIAAQRPIIFTKRISCFLCQGKKFDQYLHALFDLAQ